MTLQDLKQMLHTEKIANYVLIHDSRLLPLSIETRPPYSITLNIVRYDKFEIYRHDERGYVCFEKKNLSEYEACKYALMFAREAKNQWNF